MPRPLIWFRNDLRTHDNPALEAANRDGDAQAFFAFDPAWRGQTSFGFEKTGPHRLRFQELAVDDLAGRLRELEIPFQVVEGPAEDGIGRLDFDELHIQDHPGPEERAVARRVVEVAKAKGARVIHYRCFTLLHPSDLPFEVAETPAMFTQFRRVVERNLRVRPCVSMPEDGRRGEGGESAALARLHDYLWQSQAIRTYKETRNELMGEHASSQLSPYLAVGALSPRWVYHEVRRHEKQFGANDSTYWLIFELLWRDFFQFVLMQHGARMFHPDGIMRRRQTWSQDPALFERWRAGETGYPLVDACMKELAATGWMSNRGRQIVSSFLTKELGIDWRMGAEWFESMLIDYDVASNWGNWQYQAGVGNDGRADRRFSLRRQAELYDPEAAFVKRWLPELRPLPAWQAHEPWIQDRVKYPARVPLRSG